MAELVIEGLSKRLGNRTVVDNLSLTVGEAELVCLLGPSGCGKTTTLRMIGGFITPDLGRITIGGLDVTTMAPEGRPTAMVFQSYALWPNMTVFKNIAFGLRLRRMPKDEIAARVRHILGLVNLNGAEGRHPTQLSGGEQQRVALARALVLEPQLLLLDEPLSNLDARLRVSVREEIREIQQRLGIATVFVTHDQDEALAVSDRIAVMSDGCIEQCDRGSELYRRPRSTFVAGFIGSMNFLSVRAAPTGLLLDSEVVVPCPPASAGVSSHQRYEAAIRPEDVVVSRSITEGAQSIVRRRVSHGHFTELQLQAGPDSMVRAFVASEEELEVGEVVQVAFRRALLYRDGQLVDECGVSRPVLAGQSEFL